MTRLQNVFSYIDELENSTDFDIVLSEKNPNCSRKLKKKLLEHFIRYRAK